MTIDPIVEEVHQKRRQILADCNGDIEQLIARLKVSDEKSRDRRVTIDDIRARKLDQNFADSLES